MSRSKQSRRLVSMFEPLENRRLMATDFSISEISVTPAVLETNEYTKAKFTIYNSGDVAAPAGTRLLMAFSKDNVFGNEDDLGLSYSDLAEAVPAGGSVQVEITRRASAQPTGLFRLGGWIDSRRLVVESNEANNVAFSAADAVVYADELNTTTIIGTAGNDVISFTKKLDKAIVTFNDHTYAKDLAGVTEFFVDAGSGNDSVSASGTFPTRLAVTGAGGNDTLTGGYGNDELSGANGKDFVSGGNGNDYLLGGASADRLFGEAGNDTISGAGGADYLSSGDGTNTLYGGAGNDRFYSAYNDNADSISGNAGDDYAARDINDLIAGVEDGSVV